MTKSYYAESMPAPIEGTLGHWIRQQRQERNWSLCNLARQAGRTHQFWHEVEAGKYGVGKKSAQQLSALFGRDTAEILAMPRQLVRLRDLALLEPFVTTHGVENVREVLSQLLTGPKPPKSNPSELPSFKGMSTLPA